MPLSLNIRFRLPTAHFPISSLLRSSLSVTPSFVIRIHRKINLSTISILLSSIIICSNLPVVIIFFFLTFKYNPASSLALLTFVISSDRSSFVPAINVVSSAYLRFVTFLPPILILYPTFPGHLELFFLHIY